MAVRHIASVTPESRPRSHWEFESSSKVRTFVGSSVGTSQEVQELAIEARRNSPRRSSQSPGACRESAGASPRVHRMFTGSKPKAHRKKR